MNPWVPAILPPTPAKAIELPSADQLGDSRGRGSGRVLLPPPAIGRAWPPPPSTLLRTSLAGLTPYSTSASRWPSGAAATACAAATNPRTARRNSPHRLTSAAAAGHRA